MQITAKKTELMTTSAEKRSVQKTEVRNCDKFKYLGVDVLNDGSKPEVLSKIIQAAQLNKADASLEK